MLAKNLKKYVDTPVVIKWINPNDDWAYFRLIGFEEGRVWLRGMDSPDGCLHDGDMFDVDPSEIRTCEPR
jgi:hypothetical protein